jgi:hypothetical protein
MIAISRPLIGISALIAVGIVAVDLAQSRQTEPSPATQVASRFPQPNEMMATIAKADRMPVPAAECTREHWPYIADECLVATEGSVRRASRTITIERKISDNTSQLVRVTATALASR